MRNLLSKQRNALLYCSFTSILPMQELRCQPDYLGRRMPAPARRIALYGGTNQRSGPDHRQPATAAPEARSANWRDGHHHRSGREHSGTKGPRHPAALLKRVAHREIDLVAAWLVCRLGRSLADLIGPVGVCFDPATWCRPEARSFGMPDPASIAGFARAGVRNTDLMLLICNSLRRGWNEKASLAFSCRYRTGIAEGSTSRPQGLWHGSHNQFIFLVKLATHASLPSVHPRVGNRPWRPSISATRPIGCGQGQEVRRSAPTPRPRPPPNSSSPGFSLEHHRLDGDTDRNARATNSARLCHRIAAEPYGSENSGLALLSPQQPVVVLYGADSAVSVNGAHTPALGRAVWSGGGRDSSPSLP